MRTAEAQFGQIDVLVNNAGIGYFGAILPAMRQRKRGYIVNMSSMGGVRGAAGVGYYNATKFAVEGFSEALSHEVTPLGIKVLLVEPSGFRTDWAGRSASEAMSIIEDYAGTAGVRREQIRAGSGRQAGDPARAAAAIVRAVESPTPPMRLLLGKTAVSAVRGKIDLLRADLETWAEVSESADYPET